MSIIHLLASSNYIIVNKTLIQALGLDCAVLFGELAGEHLYWESRGELQDGFFYSTVQNVEQAIGLSDYKQRECLKKLESEGLIDVKVSGMPPVRYVRINESAILKKFEFQFSKNLSFNSQKISELNLKKFETNNNKTNNNKNNNKCRGKPTLDEVRDFIKQNKLNVDGDKFFNYYEATNWVLRGQKVTDWQALIRYWAANEKPKETQQPAAYDLELFEKQAAKVPEYKRKNKKD